jgi:hypothetical protein
MGPRRYYIRSDNIYLPDNLNRIQAIDADSPADLLDKIHIRYNFKEAVRGRIQLWSGNMGVKRERLDILDKIPERYEIIWMKGIPI